MGAAGQNFAAIAERRTACTGGLGCQPVLWQHATDPAPFLRRLRVGMKTLDAQADEALRLLGDLLFAVNPRDRERLRDVLTQSRAAHRTSLVNDALGTARRWAGRGLTPPVALENALTGPSALRRVEGLVNGFDAQSEPTMHGIARIRDFVAGPARWTVSFTGSDSVYAAFTRRLTEWSAQKSATPVVDAPPAFSPFATTCREGLAGPLNVAYCVKAMPGFLAGDPLWPVFRVGLHMVSMDYLLPEIRFKGNAYGAGATHDDGSGLLCFYSYSDPRIVETLDVFEGVQRFVQDADWNQEDINRAIIGCARDAEKPIRPGEATGQALARHVRGVTPALRERQYAAMLRATPASVKQTLLEQFELRLPRAAWCVVSAREKLDAANAALGCAPLRISDLLP
jgi:presequence protease